MENQAFYYIIDKYGEGTKFFSIAGGLEEDYYVLSKKVESLKDESIYKIIDNIRYFKNPDLNANSNKLFKIALENEEELRDLIKTDEFTKEKVINLILTEGILEVELENYLNINSSDLIKKDLKDFIENYWENQERSKIKTLVLIDILNRKTIIKTKNKSMKKLSWTF